MGDLRVSFLLDPGAWIHGMVGLGGERQADPSHSPKAEWTEPLRLSLPYLGLMASSYMFLASHAQAQHRGGLTPRPGRGSNHSRERTVAGRGPGQRQARPERQKQMLAREIKTQNKRLHRKRWGVGQSLCGRRERTAIAGRGAGTSEGSPTSQPAKPAHHCGAQPRSRGQGGRGETGSTPP